jgi:hypothetical protein
MPPMKRLTGGRIAGLWATAKERSRGPFPPCCSLWTASKVMRTRVELREPVREPPAFRRGTCEYPSAFAGERRGAERYRVSTRHCVHRSGMGRCQHRNRGRRTDYPTAARHPPSRIIGRKHLHRRESVRRAGQSVRQSAPPMFQESLKVLAGAQ